MHSAPEKMTGVLLLDKPPEMTSHDVVDAVRSLVPGVRVGHAGTLDPNATGLLLVLLGKGTKVSRFLMGLDKEYVFTVQLGIETTTLDRWGEVVRTADAGSVGECEIMAAAGRFKGRYQQIAPSVSALKHKGVPLYKMARRGEPTPIKTRVVVLKKFEVMDIDSPFVTIRVACSSGTYVRSLARDLGTQLGCGATVYSLRRTAVGSFGVDAAVPLGGLSEGKIKVEDVMLTLEAALVHLPAIRVKRESIQRIKSGGQPADKDLCDPDPGFEADYVALTDEAGMIFGIAKRSDRAGAMLRIERIL
jgi:tRNA pseudouridine55 synthase